ncbi:hypothetical protein B9K09_00080 [Pseudomonas sp. M30-35]|nr:hypothetical protein B9K09_00080 [Pseudomonas sp. M30-35]
MLNVLKMQLWLRRTAQSQLIAVEIGISAYGLLWRQQATRQGIGLTQDAQPPALADKHSLTKRILTNMTWPTCSDKHSLADGSGWFAMVMWGAA